MTTAYQHRPLSSILAPAHDPNAEGSKDEQPRDERGKFASPEPKKTDFELPEKYRGKTAEEIAEMHMNAERELGRMRNEVGTYRGLVNDLTSLQRQTPSEPQKVEQEKIDVSGDELFSNPAGAIDKVVTARLNEREKATQVASEKTKFDLETKALVSDFPDLDSIVASREFQEFASRTPSRQQDFLTAAQGEGLEQVRAARRLLENFQDFQSNLQPSAADDRPAPEKRTDVQRAASVKTEGSGPSGSISTKPTIYEADVLNLIRTDPAKYRSPSFQKELMAAIREGRFVKVG